mgnify:CR=1 FL=1
MKEMRPERLLVGVTPAELSWCSLSYALEFAKDDKLIEVMLKESIY